MHVALKELLAWTARHHDTITDRALMSAGVTIAQRKRLLADGVLQRLIDGTYRLGGDRDSELARCVGACARPIGLVVCGPTAGRIWGFRRMPNDGLVHVLAPPASNPSVVGWLRPYRTDLLAPADVVDTDEGIRLTSPPRTAVDLARHLRPPDLRSVIDQVIAEGRGTAATMRRIAEPLATPGRGWARRFVAELDRLPGGGAPESHGESTVVAALIERGVNGLQPQRWLRVPNNPRIRLDAAVPSIRWGVEVDAHPDHFTEAGVTADHRRDYACASIDWRVDRVTRMMLRDDFEATIDLLMGAYWRRVLEVERRLQPA